MSLGHACRGTPPPSGALPRPAPPRPLHKGLTLGARPAVHRAMVVRSCWHTRPVFRLTVRVLQDPDLENHMTALVFFTEASGRAGERVLQGAVA